MFLNCTDIAEQNVKNPSLIGSKMLLASNKNAVQKIYIFRVYYRLQNWMFQTISQKEKTLFVKFSNDGTT